MFSKFNICHAQPSGTEKKFFSLDTEEKHISEGRHGNLQIQKLVIFFLNTDITAVWLKYCRCDVTLQSINILNENRDE